MGGPGGITLLFPLSNNREKNWPTLGLPLLLSAVSVRSIYPRAPSRSIRHHRGLTRLDNIILFKLRSNKGWGSQRQRWKLQPPPPCSNCALQAPRDGHHVMTCPAYSCIRPARWINLAIPGNIIPPSSFTCDLCSRTYTNPSHLGRHRRQIHPDGRSTLFTIGSEEGCMQCTLRFPNKTLADLHLASTHGPDCHRKFSDITNIYRHLIKQHGGVLSADCTLRAECTSTKKISQFESQLSPPGW